MCRSALPFAFLAALSLHAAEHLEISVCDDAAVSPAVWRHVRGLVGYVMGRAGIAVAWSSCGAVARPFVPRVTVRIRPGVATSPSDALVTLGRSFRVLSRREYAEVYIDAVRRYAARIAGADSADVLGCALLHETGHLLGLRHSARGLMAETFGEIEIAAVAQRRLRFTSAQSRALLDELRRRVALEPPADLDRLLAAAPPARTSAAPDDDYPPLR